jgi:hypothetical protein
LSKIVGAIPHAGCPKCRGISPRALAKAAKNFFSASILPTSQPLFVFSSYYAEIRAGKFLPKHSTLMQTKLLLSGLFLFLQFTLLSQAPVDEPYRLAIRKSAEIIRLDGALDEPAWQNAQVAKDFFRNPAHF